MKWRLRQVTNLAFPATLMTMNHFLVFGTHPRLSLAEWQTVAGGRSRPIISGNGALVQADEWDSTVLMNRLGGTVKLGDIIGQLPTNEVTGEAVAQMLDEAQRFPVHAFDYGWSTFGGGKGINRIISKEAIPFKKALKMRERSSRWVTTKGGEELSPAAVAKLKLTTQGLDICFFIVAEVTYIGLSTEVQDADAWSLRDYGRPRRDDVNGMLPPKLARMMVNLAQVPPGATLLDPFCGGGTVLMEAALATQAKHLIGSDAETKQIADAEANVKWLVENHVLRADDAERFRHFACDARKLAGHVPANSVDRVVTEGYLGPALHGHESEAQLNKNVEVISALWRESLKALTAVLAQNGRVVGIWPAFRTSGGMARVDLTEELADLGLKLVEPLEELEGKAAPLLYSRPGQFVQRRIVILERK